MVSLKVSGQFNNLSTMQISSQHDYRVGKHIGCICCSENSISGGMGVGVAIKWGIKWGRVGVGQGRGGG